MNDTDTFVTDAADTTINTEINTKTNTESQSNDAPVIVFAADVLAKYPTLIPEADGRMEYADFRIYLDGRNFILRDCRLVVLTSEIQALYEIANSRHSRPLQRHRAHLALERIADALAAKLKKFGVLPTSPCADQILISNNPYCRILAKLDGAKAIPLHLPEPEPYTGIRYLQAPAELCDKLVTENYFTEDYLRQFFPDEPPFQPNEYIVLYRGEQAKRLHPRDYLVQQTRYKFDDYYNVIARYYARDRFFMQLVFRSDVALPDDSPALAAYYDALHDPSIESIVVTGPAGSGKTYSAMDFAVQACRKHDYIHTVVLKEGDSPIGAVKGNVQAKMMPKVQFAQDALRSARLKQNDMQKKFGINLPQPEPEPAEAPDPADDDGHPAKPRPGKAKKRGGVKKPEGSIHQQVEASVDNTWNEFFTSAPYEEACGRNFERHVIIIDEAQRISYDMLDTLLTRSGTASKLIVMGDYAQMAPGDAVERSGLAYASLLLQGSDSVAHIELSKVLRSSTAAIVVANRARARRALGLPD